MVPERYQGVGGNIIFKQLSENTLNNAGCETSRHFGNKLRGLFGTMTNQYTIISQIISVSICEIVVYLLVTVQNNKRRTTHVLKLKKNEGIFER
jgi:phage-related tail protein